MSDEAHFEQTGNVNCHNCRYWSKENPKEIHQRPLHSERETVWFSVARFDVIGPYFFFYQNGVTVTVNAERYVDMIQNFLVPQLQHLDIEMDYVWFQQCSATAPVISQQYPTFQGAPYEICSPNTSFPVL